MKSTVKKTIPKTMQKAKSLQGQHSPQEDKPRFTPKIEGCPRCDYTGYYRYDLPFGHPQFGRIYPCECQKVNTLKQLEKHTRLTETERQYTFGSFVTNVQNRYGTSKMITAAKNFVADPDGFLTICGTFGNGKTTCLMAIVNHCVGLDIQAVYITLYDLISYVRDAFTNADESEWSRVNKLAEVRVLCIDEFDKIKESIWTQQIITHVLDVRYRNSVDGKSGTVIAFNGKIEDIQHKWIRSRMEEGTIIVNTDPDVRPEIAKVKKEVAFEDPNTGEVLTM